MSGFRKAKAEQAAIKMGVYGPAGSGKTFTALLMAEGLAAATKKRVAYIDTEHGTDFYCQAVAARAVHPEAFDFDALYTRSIIEGTAAVDQLDLETYGVLVLDSVTHLWESAIAAYAGKKTSIDSIPMHAWGKIKKPYKDLMAKLLASPLHVIFCGRQGTEYATDEETEELKAVGYKMKAEGETPYEPHILIRMQAVKPTKTHEVAQIIAYAEKDRTGVLAGRSFVNPTFADLCGPVLPLLGTVQAAMDTVEATATKDAEAMVDQERERGEVSMRLLREWSAKIQLAADGAALKEVGKGITPKLKAQMLPSDVVSLREVYQAREAEIGKGGAK